MLISIDGVDGCGKSTQVRMLTEKLGAENIIEISDSPWGRKLRSLESPTLGEQLAYFTADRAQLSEKIASASGSPDRHVVSDRSYLSSIGYQSYDTGLAPSMLEEMGLALMPKYDLQLVCRVPIDVALGRIESRGEAKTWCENPGLLTWAARIFDTWEAQRDYIVSVDATKSIEEVHAQVMEQVERVSREKFGRLVW